MYDSSLIAPHLPHIHVPPFLPGPYSQDFVPCGLYLPDSLARDILARDQRGRERQGQGIFFLLSPCF